MNRGEPAMATNLLMIPKRKDWQKLKTDTGCPDEPVKGIKMGDSLDKFNQRDNTIAGQPLKDRIPAMIALYTEMESFFAGFIKKVDPKTVKNYAKFKQTFLDDYADLCRRKKEDTKRYAPGVEEIRTDLATFFAMLMKIDPAKAPMTDLSKFRSGPLRGLMASLARAGDAAPHAAQMTALLKPFDDLINKSPDLAADKVPALCKEMFDAAAKLKPLAKADGLL
jgi:hypothetical protein